MHMRYEVGRIKSSLLNVRASLKLCSRYHEVRSAIGSVFGVLACDCELLSL